MWVYWWCIRYEIWDENKTIIGLKYKIKVGTVRNFVDENKTIIGLKF